MIVCGDDAEAASIARILAEAGHGAVRASASLGRAADFELAVVAPGSLRATAEGLLASGSGPSCPTVLLPEGGGLDALRAILGRRSPGGTVLRVADLTIDRERQEVWRAGRLIALTRTQFNLLVALAGRAGQVLSYHAIWLAAWGGRVPLPEHPERPHPEPAPKAGRLARVVAHPHPQGLRLRVGWPGRALRAAPCPSPSFVGWGAAAGFF